MNYFDCKITTRYSETDQMGVCYYANYLVWYEVSRTDYFKAIDLPYTMFEQKGIFLPVGEVYCRYYKPLVYDDDIIVRVWISKLKRSSIQFSYHVIKGASALIAEGNTTHVFVDKKMKPCRIPEEISSTVVVLDEAPSLN